MPDEFDQTSDAALVRRALGGDQTGVSAMVDRHADAVYADCLAGLGAEDAALRAVHTTFLRAAARLSKLADPSRLREWLLAIARRELAGRQRKKLFARGNDSAESPGPLVSSQEDLVALERLRHRIALDMMVALGFGPALPATGSPSGPATSFRFSELWPTSNVDDDDWEWRHDGFPLAWTGGAPWSRMLITATAAAALALVISVVTLALLTSGPEVEVSGIVESTDDLEKVDDNPRLVGDPGKAKTAQDGSASTASTAELAAAKPPTTSDGTTGSSDGSATDDTTTVVQPTTEGESSSTSGPSSTNATTTTLAPRRTTVGPTDPPSETSSSSTTIGASTSSPSPTTAATTTTRPATTTTRPVTTTTRQATTTTRQATTTTSTAAPTTTTTAQTTTTTAAPTTTTTTAPTTTTTTTTTSTTTTTTTTTPNMAPVVANVSRNPGSVRVSSGECVPGTATVSADASDADGSIQNVVAQWSANGQTTIETPMTNVGGETYEAVIGTWFVVGTQTIVVVATDDDGAEAQGSRTIKVRSCP